MMKGKLYTIVIHSIGWLLFFSLPAIFIISQSMDGNVTFFSGNFFNLVGFGVYILIFYIHTFFLLPHLYFRKKRVLYFLIIALLFTLVFVLRPFERLSSGQRPGRNEMENQPSSPGNFPPIHRNIERPLPPPEREPRTAHLDIISIALFILVIVLSIALALERRWRVAIEQTARAETDKANAELSFLKAQINPHFLFNTLNNIYSLAVTKSENVADAIMKLSNIMRYVTDEVNEDFVLLQKEVDFITDYISLQRLRLGKKVYIDFIIEGNMGSKTIAPLILMPFIENAFKHGISNSVGSNIVIKLSIRENDLVFYTENKVFLNGGNQERTGIGSTNSKKRLAQIYPGKYQLDIGENNGLYTVHLVMYI